MMKKKIKAFLIPQVIMFLIALSVFSFSAMATIPTVFGSLAAEGDAVQAMQYAEIEANIIKLLNYDDIDDDDVLLASNLHTTRADLTAINVPGWEDEVIIGDEELMGDGENKYKIATINIYKKDDTIPRATLEVPLTSQAGADNLPVGTILAYTGNLADIPNGWHLCDGTDGTPNLLDNRFLEGSANIGIYNEPGLPNIIGVINGVYNGSGAFKWLGIDSNKYAWGTGNFGTDQFDASFSNPIYGKSNTVQPASYTVYYIIKIK